MPIFVGLDTGCAMASHEQLHAVSLPGKRRWSTTDLAATKIPLQFMHDVVLPRNHLVCEQLDSSQVFTGLGLCMYS